jgi:hypothetical protein
MRSSLLYSSIGSALLLVLAGAAFWPQYVKLLPGGPDTYAHFHAALATLWLLMLIAQPLLIRRRRMELHRWVGRASWVIAPLYVIAAVLLAHFRFGQMDDALFARLAFALYLPLSMTVLFAVSYVFALVYQRDMQLHARFMMCTALTAIDPILARLLFFHVADLPRGLYQAISFSLLAIALILFTLTLPASARRRQVFAGFSAGFVTVLALWFILPRSSAWFAFAAWFRALPLT